jgi:hypothetical protein
MLESFLNNTVDVHSIKDFDFSDEDLLNLAFSLKPSREWIKAFDFYNKHNPNNKLSIGCRPCYNKVLVFLLKIRFLNNQFSAQKE